MRRVYAFIVMVTAILALIVGFAPYINDEKNLGMDYYGGFEVLYQIEQPEESDFSDREVARSFADSIERRLSINNVLNYYAETESSSFVRVGISTPSLLEKNQLLDIVEDRSEITFRNQNDDLLATGDDLLTKGGSRVSSQRDDFGNFLVELDIADTTLLEQITTSVSQDEQGELVIWLNFEEGEDSFADMDSEPRIEEKVIYNAGVEEPISDPAITMSGFESSAEASLLASIINSTTYDFEINYEQMSQIAPEEGESNFNDSILAFAFFFLGLFILFVVFYRRVGIILFTSVAFSTFLSLLTYNFLQGSISLSALVGLIVGIFILIDSMVIILERVKKELKNRENINKSYMQGFKKSISAVVDSNIAILVGAIVVYIIGSNLLKDFAVLLGIKIIISFIVLITINHLMLATVSKTKLIKSKFCFGGNSEKNKERKPLKINAFSLSNKFLILSGSILLLSFIVSLASALIFNTSFFGLSDDFSEGSHISVETTDFDNHFANDTAVIDFFEQEANIEVENVNVFIEDREDVTYIFEATTNYNALNERRDLEEALITRFGENTPDTTNYVLVFESSSLDATLLTIQSAAFVMVVTLLGIGAYLLIRYRYTYTLATFFTALFNVILVFALINLFRVAIEITLIPALVAIIFFGTSSMVVVFDRVKEFLSAKKRVYISNEERKEAVEKALDATLTRFFMTIAFIVVLITIYTVFAPATFLSFNIKLIFGILASFTSSLLVAPRVWLLLEKRKDKRKRKIKPKKVKQKKFKELEEKTFAGIND